MSDKPIDEPLEIRRNLIFPGQADEPGIRLVPWSDGSVTWSNNEQQGT